MRRLRTELRALLELVLLPGLAAVLPWRACFALFRRLARWPWLYRVEWMAALAAARRFVAIDDDRDWAWRYRLMRLLDHADLWLSLSRGHRWRRRWLRREGEWPAGTGPFVGAFFHWGPGLWPVRDLNASGRRAAVLAGHFDRASMGGASIAERYGALRLRELARAGGRPLIFAPGTVRTAMGVLAEGDCVIGTPDVPAVRTRLAAPVRIFGRDAWFPAGLVEIARRAGVPLCAFVFPPDLDGGRRGLRLLGEFDPADPGLPQALASRWESLLREASWAFTLWPAIDGFFVPPPDAPAGP